MDGDLNAVTQIVEDLIAQAKMMTVLGISAFMGLLLPAAAYVLSERGHLTDAVTVLSAALNHPKVYKALIPHVPIVPKLESALRDQLFADAYEAAWGRGTSMQTHEATDLYLEAMREG